MHVYVQRERKEIKVEFKVERPDITTFKSSPMPSESSCYVNNKGVPLIFGLTFHTFSACSQYWFKNSKQKKFHKF
jgi:hypothetical protein